jgi:hypothetical protein
MAKLDDLYKLWCSKYSDEDLGNLLEGIRALAIRSLRSKCKDNYEDVAQQVVIVCWRTLGKFNPSKSSMYKWVKLTCEASLNRSLVTTYRNKARVSLDLNTITTEDGDSMLIDDRLQYGFIDDPQLLNLLLEGHSLSECAIQLGITRKAARYRLQKAIRRAQSAHL